jgi:hypothetical protein
MSYTLNDLKEADQKVDECERRIDSHRANNPDFGRADLRSARFLRDLIVRDLKNQGLIPRTEKEILEAELDAAFPKAKSKEIVSFKGKRFQRRFWPARMSRSGKTVMEWERSWEPVEG